LEKQEQEEQEEQEGQKEDPKIHVHGKVKREW